MRREPRIMGEVGVALVTSLLWWYLSEGDVIPHSEPDPSCGPATAAAGERPHTQPYAAESQGTAIISLISSLLVRQSQSFNRMMLQHTGPSLADISCSAMVPCLSPPGTLTLDDFANFTPIVKEELRLAIQSKRLSSGLSADVSSDGASSSSDRMSEMITSGAGGKREFTPEEHERRKRRRERNKIAAAKCRNKKKEKTESLQKESEKLETVNADLKAQIEELKQQKQQLVYMLNLHRPTCIVRAQNGQTPEDERNLFIQHIKESALQLQNLTSSITSISSSAAAATTTTTTSSATTLDTGLLSLEHVHCSGHL